MSGPLRSGRGAPDRRLRNDERGSIVLFALFVCLGVAVLVQTLSVIAMCADGAVAAEDSGRRRMEEKDEALGLLRRRAVQVWGPLPWAVVREGTPEVEGALTDIVDSQGLVLEATVRQKPEVSDIVVSGLMERGRDGLDLPLAGVVADGVEFTAGRTSPWLEIEAGEVALAASLGAATGYLGSTSAMPPVGPDVTVATVDSPWRLDEGWRMLAGQGAAGIAVCAPQACILADEQSLTTDLPAGWGVSADSPGLVVVLGGSSLDATGRGDLYGVIVVDDGDVWLDGTRLHGAVITTGDVDVGSDGALVFAPRILRWATDRSLQRARLIPGTRWERTG